MPPVIPSLWALTAPDLAVLKPPGDAAGLYGRLVRAQAYGRALALGREAHAFVAQQLNLALPEVVSAHPSVDGSTKFVLSLADGAHVEAVWMPRAVKNPRVTLCISSQVGCAMGCTFCHTARMGLVRNLGAAEMVGQVVQLLRQHPEAQMGRVSVVFMGMGEPLHNAGEVRRAVAVLADEAGLAIAPSRQTVSTSGLVPGILELAGWPVRPTLALSVNATTDAARARTMPITRKWNLAELRAALAAISLRSHEKITLEYVLLRGENDSLQDAQRLAEFARGLRHHVNVIPFNAFEGAGFAEPEEPVLEAFLRELWQHGCLATVRRSRGRDVGAACGQLLRPGEGRGKRRTLTLAAG